jgi:hypothetical protein
MRIALVVGRLYGEDRLLDETSDTIVGVGLISSFPSTRVPDPMSEHRIRDPA